MGQSEDAGEGPHDRGCPESGFEEFQAAFAPAAHQAGGDVEDAVAQCPGGGLGLLAVQREKLEPGAKVVAVSQAALTFVSWEGSRPIPDALLSRLDAGVLAVPGVEVGDLTAATVGGEGPVADLLLDLVVGGVLEAAGGRSGSSGRSPDGSSASR
ncbi:MULTISPECIES: hypothetical protein [unclassified Streptomyces]|uniref:hypothetical protein n=1 Tax=unclassified Streptomyces TaxID=2593676 RepID=UPI00224F79F2|nr:MULTISPECIES: hypothetical protein [unclassified Streptomyces]MCX4792039.1 hypothetical protein [Streptomyces sp. NBC_01221]WSP53280.1 hypothetical protein OG306_01730 [Streptomyces sp. NBC_01241]WSP66886.1 hypothetical protein OG466_37270 [Streptomyces sp. NBC_01240]